MDTLQSIILLPYELSIYTEDLSGDELNAFIVLSSGKALNSGMRTLNQRVENLLLLLMVICTFFLFFFFGILYQLFIYYLFTSLVLFS